MDLLTSEHGREEASEHMVTQERDGGGGASCCQSELSGLSPLCLGFQVCAAHSALTGLYFLLVRDVNSPVSYPSFFPF